MIQDIYDFDFDDADSQDDQDSGDDAFDSGEDLIYADPSHMDEFGISFHSLPPNANSDGFIRDGQVTLESVSGHIHKTFTLYKKGGNYYVYDNRWIKINGIGTVKIDNVDYEKI